MKPFCLLLLASSVLAAQPAAPFAHIRQVHHQRVSLLKREAPDDGPSSTLRDKIYRGNSCAHITGNPDDIVCDVKGDIVSCAPTCCLEPDTLNFVDGCPADDRCAFDDSGLRCCARKATCGDRPTICINYADSKTATAPSGAIICPSETPSCVTRSDGGAACTGSNKITLFDPIRSVFPTKPIWARPQNPYAIWLSMVGESKADRLWTSEASVRVDVDVTLVTPTTKSTKTGSVKVPSTTMDMGKDMSRTATTGEVTSRTPARVRSSISGTSSITYRVTVTATETAPTRIASPSGNSAGSGGIVRENPIFGLLVAVALAFGILL
ncbi:hypothetical protein TWF694_005436 [Orbilia ellipsospora]|uniref:Uncharacterized protein n=1 Tax=Orbilia ellipsospora TaxID=2528407 RepID=A0AAV9WT37_9PEZI